jgi:SAM-dependent methyltransferase
MNPFALEETARTLGVIGGLPLAEGPIRLLLGGRTTRIKGFWNVDLYEGDAVDIRTDAGDLSMFGDGLVSEIYASHILEHFSHTKTLDVLKEWNRVLAPGGKLYVSVPDFARAIELFHKMGMTQYIVNLLWGDQGYDLAYHYAPFTFPRLMDLLMKSGFRDAKKITEMPYGIRDCSHNIDTIDRKPISLSMEAIK